MPAVEGVQSNLITDDGRQPINAGEQEQDVYIVPEGSTQCKLSLDKVQTEDGTSSGQDEEDQGHEQAAVLQPELLNIILSYTGNSAAVLAAGPVGLKTWSDWNITNWLLQRYTDMNGRIDMLGACSTAVRNKLSEPARLIFTNSRDTCDLDAWGNVMVAAAQDGCQSLVRSILDWLNNGFTDKSQARKVCRLMMEAACRSGQLQVVKQLLNKACQHCCQPNEEDNKYLYIAVKAGHVDVVKELLDPAHKHCAKGNAFDSCALYLAARHGHAGILLELLDTSRKHHAKANDDNCCALTEAACFGYLDCVRVLLDTSRPSCAPANAADNLALRVAATHGHLNVVQELLNTSRPNHATADACGSAGLLSAVTNGHADVLRELLWQEHRPADPQTPAGAEALQMAVAQGNVECCRLLLEFPGLPPRALDEPLLKTAAGSKNSEILALIKEANRRYQRVVGPRSIYGRYNGAFTLYAVSQFLILHSMATNKDWQWLKAPCAVLGCVIMLILLRDAVMFAFFRAYGSARRTAAEQKAALENAEYRAAWYKARQ